jgi:hypothetical protein
MRTVLVAGLAFAAVTRGAAAQDEAALRAAFEGKTIAVRIDMPATSKGVEVYPLDPTPLDFRELAQRLKDNGTAVRMGQQMMVTKVVVKGDSHIEFQLGGGGYGTFGDELGNGSDVHVQSAGETKEERALRESIKNTADKGQRKRLERELDALRSERQRENARAQADAQQANLARETLLRAKRAESGSRFNIRYRNGIPAEALTPEGVVRALTPYVDFPGAPAAVSASAGVIAPVAGASAGISGLRKGQTVREVEALLGPAALASEAKEGSITITRRTYRHDGKQVVANFVSGVLVDFSITPQ